MIQWPRGFTTLCSRYGRLSRFTTTMSIPPSLSMSPNAAARLVADKRRAGPAARRDLLEARPGQSAEQQARLGIRIGRVHLRLATDPAIRFVQVELAVVVEIAERRPEPCERTARRPQSDGHGVVDEELPLVPEERIRFAVEIHDQQIEIAVVVDVDGVDAHTGLRRAVLIERASHRERRLSKATATLVQPQMIRRAIVGDEDVDAAVAVEVAGDDAEAVADGGQRCRLSRRRR